MLGLESTMSRQTDACLHCGFPLHLPPIRVNPPPNDIIRLSQNNLAHDISPTQVNQRIIEIECRLQQIARQIVFIDDQLPQLRAEQDRLEVYIQAYQRVNNPCRRVPEEVLFRIFRNYLEDSDMMDPDRRRIAVSHPNTLHPSHPIWTLGQVCQRWRQLMLSNRREWISFWTHIGIVFPETLLSEESLTNMVVRLMAQLQRSRDYPLTLYLSSSHGSGILSDQDHRLITAVCVHSNHWKTLRIDFGSRTRQFLGALSSMACRNTPQLRRVSLVLPPHWEPDYFTSNVHLFRCAPVLTDFAIIGNKAWIHSQEVPWSQLTRYRCRPETLDSSQYFPRHPYQLTRIEALTLHQQFTPNTGTHSIPVLTLPLLHTLAFKAIVKGDIQSHLPSSIARDAMDIYLRNLILPNLRDFRLYVGPDVRETVPSLPEFLGRAPCLKSLCLHIAGVPTVRYETAAQIFEQVPMVENLSLLYPSNGLIRAVAEFDGDQPRFLPRLRCLTVASNRSWTFDARDAILRAVQQRTRLLTHPLCKLRIDCRAGFHPPDRVLVRSQGVELEMFSYNQDDFFFKV